MGGKISKSAAENAGSAKTKKKAEPKKKQSAKVSAVKPAAVKTAAKKPAAGIDENGTFRAWDNAKTVAKNSKSKT